MLEKEFEREFGPFKRIFDIHNVEEKMYINPQLILSDHTLSEHIKPKYSYTQLITEALMSTKDKKMTLNQIYTYIEEKYPYYRNKKIWQNSVRHNLSLNRNFLKVKRPTNMPGKGGFWMLIEDGESKNIDSNSSEIEEKY